MGWAGCTERRNQEDKAGRRVLQGGFEKEQQQRRVEEADR